jgi:hypothetical protein
MRRRGRTTLMLSFLLALAPPLAAQQASNPHGTLPQGMACTACHTTQSWSPLRRDLEFDHGAVTGFALDGRHAEVSCVSCHGMTFDQVDARLGDCGSCHVDVHRGTITAPCVGCHDTTSFADLDRGVVHPAAFPLEGAHLQISCESCHVDDLGGAYRALDRECTSCHLADYESVPLVDHEQLGFSTDCTECHSTIDFRDVAFDHVAASNGFELLGGHAGLECRACHVGPGGEVSPPVSDANDCYGCHSDDYNGEHGGSGFPTDCVACHNTFNWDAVDFDHTFQIFGGPHGGEWDTCADCHTVPSDYDSFSCFGCHSQRDMDDKHREESGYAYDSQTCLNCHPTGRKEDE